MQLAPRAVADVLADRDQGVGLALEQHDPRGRVFPLLRVLPHLPHLPCLPHLPSPCPPLVPPRTPRRIAADAGDAEFGREAEMLFQLILIHEGE